MYRVLTVGFAGYPGMSLEHLIPNDSGDVSIHEVADLGQAQAILGTGSSYRLLIVSLDSGDLQALAALQRLRKRYRDLVTLALVDPETDIGGAIATISNLLHNLKTAPSVPQYPLPEPMHTARVDMGVPSANASASITSAGPEQLTPRQRDVLRLLKEGNSNKEIARHLNLTEGTVKTHCMAIYRVLGVTNRTQAALAAGAMGTLQVSRCA